MNTYPDFPTRLNWTSHDLADAVPRRLRLHEVFAIDAPQVSAGNDPHFRAPRARSWRAGYAAPTPLPVLFRVHS